MKTSFHLQFFKNSVLMRMILEDVAIIVQEDQTSASSGPSIGTMIPVASPERTTHA